MYYREIESNPQAAAAHTQNLKTRAADRLKANAAKRKARKATK